jgi:hypothetical protein
MLKQPLLTLQALLDQIAGYVTQLLPVAATLENVVCTVASLAALFGPLDWLQGCHRRIASLREQEDASTHSFLRSFVLGMCSQP